MDTETQDTSFDGSQNIRLAPPTKREDAQRLDVSDGSLIVEKRGGGQLPDISAASFDFRKSSHPIVCFFTMFFKVAAVLCYIIFNWVFNNFLMTFITVSILIACDFWMVKNVSGRILVGLRWWVYLTPEGEEKWRYETRNTEAQASRVDYAIFWYFQLFVTAYWGLLTIINLMTFAFGRASLDLLCVALLGTNLYNYYKCSKSSQASLKQMKDEAGQAIAKKAFSYAAQKAFNLAPQEA